MNTTHFCSFVNLLLFCYKADNLFDLCFNTPYSYISVFPYFNGETIFSHLFQ